MSSSSHKHRKRRRRSSQNYSSSDSDDNGDVDPSRRQKFLKLAKSIVVKRPQKARPQAIGKILFDAAETAADAMNFSTTDNGQVTVASISDARMKTEAAFTAADVAIEEAQDALDTLQNALNEARKFTNGAFDEVESTIGCLESANTTSSSSSPPAATEKILDETSDQDFDISSLSYDDVGYEMSEMAPPFIGEDMCLVPGVALVRVERAPENSRRIFAGIDILASMHDVWNVLTDYENLQRVVPNLVLNEVEELYTGDPDTHTANYIEENFIPSISSSEQCKSLTKKLKGARLRQVGGAKVVGINFSARTSLEVREWPEGMPDFAHFNDDVYNGDSREQRVRDSKEVPLQRYVFPRPFAISKLPTKDISMQSLENDDGEFRMYQGVWRMQPLPGCAGVDGGEAMRLTYAVEISPRAYLPVRLVENRIAQDLCRNLEAIRDFVTKAEESE